MKVILGVESSALVLVIGCVGVLYLMRSASVGLAYNVCLKYNFQVLERIDSVHIASFGELIDGIHST